ncbi:MAG: OB-fold domain-containing protein [Alphaproteobacteria bacterium]|nr:OB-fold domain-containing protein [Alphaproteobacteria bacterium]
MKKKTQAAPQSFVTSETQEFWAAAQENKLLVKHCRSCGENHYYPRSRCPLCGSAQTEWLAATGKGTIYSFSIIPGARRPTATAIVDLDEGPRLSSVILDADVNQLKIGDGVTVAFEKMEGRPPAPAFTTAAAVAARAYSVGALKASKNFPDLAATVPDEVKIVAIIGAGTMGTGIATACLKSGLSVVLIDSNESALQKAESGVSSALERDVERGILQPELATAFKNSLTHAVSMESIRSADLVIEAVWEQLKLKQDIFGQIDKFARPNAVLCSNTSTLDIDEIAGATQRPQDVVGVHFFSPAHVMKLVEIIRGKTSTSKALATCIRFGETIGKVPVVVGNCYGFVGNRLMLTREREAARLLLEGALPVDIDTVLKRFGMPMGTFELQDMAGGIELNYRRRQETGEKNFLVDRLFELGRLGQKTQKGYYRYDPEKRGPIPDAEVTEIIEQASEHYGISRKPISDSEIEKRLILPMINEGAKLLDEGIVARPSDIDVVWQYGYGWPSWKGGPMYYADQIGVSSVLTDLTDLFARHGAPFEPSPLLSRMAKSGQTFSSL